MPRDPRLYQIAVLSGLMGYGVLALDLQIEPLIAVVILVAALATQGLCGRLVGLERFDPKSPLISALSLCLLLRTSSLALAAVAAVVTIASKFLIRAKGKHIFNPTNFGLAAMMLASDRVWVSPGQWGSTAFFGFLLAAVGMWVIHRTERSDVTWAFLAAYVALLFGRAIWLGDPLAIPWHQLQNGALLIFAFFMISDPRTTPDHRVARRLFAVLVASLAAYIQFNLFQPNSLIWALVCCSPLVPLCDRFLTATRYRWPEATTARKVSSSSLSWAVRATSLSTWTAPWKRNLS